MCDAGSTMLYVRLGHLSSHCPCHSHKFGAHSENDIKLVYYLVHLKVRSRNECFNKLIVSKLILLSTKWQHWRDISLSKLFIEKND